MNLIVRLAATGLLLLASLLPADAYLISRDGGYNNISGIGPAAPFIQVLDGNGAGIASGSPTVLTSTADVPLGSTIVVAVNLNSGANEAVDSCADNATVGGSINTYVVNQPAPVASVANSALCVVVNTTRDIPPGSVWTVVTHLGHTYNVRGVWYVTGYNGGVDQSASVNQATPGSSVAGVTTGTLANVADLAIGYVSTNAAVAIAESPLFHNLFNNTFNSIGYDAVTSTAALTYAPTWTGGTANYSAVLLTFLPTGAGGGCPTATTLLAKLDGGQNTSAVTNAVCGLVSDGVWAKLDGFYVYAINSATNARLNWVSTSFNLTINGTCTFTANAGYTGNGTNCYQATGFTPSTAAGHWTLNSASLGSCVLTSRTTGSFHYLMGTNSDTVNFTTWAAIGDNMASTNLTYGVNQGFVTSTQTNVQGSWMASRETSILTTFYHNGTSASSTNTAAGALSANPLTLMALNGATIGNFNPDQFAYFFYGAGLTATDITNLNNRMHTYLSAVGAPAGC